MTSSSAFAAHCEPFNSNPASNCSARRGTRCGFPNQYRCTRAHLGIETQRQWSDKAVALTTPCALPACLLRIYSIVTLAAQRLFSSGHIYQRCAA
jgi:hypothetical protein